MVPNVLVKQWKAEGVLLTDSAAADVDPGIHVLLGADVASDLLVQKVVSERGESAWRTKIGMDGCCLGNEPRSCMNNCQAPQLLLSAMSRLQKRKLNAYRQLKISQLRRKAANVQHFR